MAKVLQVVLGKEAKVEKTTNSYIDDILVEGKVASVKEIGGYLRGLDWQQNGQRVLKEVQYWGSNSKETKWVGLCFAEETRSQA